MAIITANATATTVTRPTVNRTTLPLDSTLRFIDALLRDQRLRHGPDTMSRIGLQTGNQL